MYHLLLVYVCVCSSWNLKHFLISMQVQFTQKRYSKVRLILEYREINFIEKASRLEQLYSVGYIISCLEQISVINTNKKVQLIKLYTIRRLFLQLLVRKFMKPANPRTRGLIFSSFYFLLIFWGEHLFSFD